MEDLGTAANHLWTGLYFGGFGAAAAITTPLMDWVFGGDKKESVIDNKSPARASTITIELSPQQQKEMAEGLTNFRERIKSGRVAEESCRSA